MNREHAIFAAQAQPRLRRRWIFLLVILILGGGAAMAVWRDPLLIGRATAVVAQARVALVPQAAVPKPLPPRIVPVTAVEARQGDMDLNLNGLGTVVASNTVIIRSRVDGELIEVAFAEGQPVEAGDLLAVVDPRPYEVQLRRAEAELARDEAAVQAAKRDLERYESLAELRQATQQQIETQQTLVRQAEAVAKIDRSLIDTAKLQLDYCRIEAPISGRIGLRLVDAGNIVRAGDAAGLAVIASVRPIAVTFTIPQDEIIRVQRALAATGRLPVEAYNRDLRVRLADGELTAIDNQVDSSTGTIKLKAMFPNEDDALFPNQFVNARLLVETLRGTTLVPLAAVQHGPESSFVWVVGPDTTVGLRIVETGPTQGDMVSVTSGLKAGELVVIDGIDKLTPKTKVTLRSMKTTGNQQPPTAAAGH
ncbi:MAG: MdtA/MuxA family multidrug efflux RND transporter periplasmic adaptor subunit [Planctomycetota bacterium]